MMSDSNSQSGRLSLRLLPRRAGKTVAAVAMSTRLRKLRAQCEEVERFVFCAAPGRSGTGTLATVLAAGDGVAAFHQPFPHMRTHVLKAAAAGRERSVRTAWRRLKLPMVLSAARGHRIYAETNHQFIKTFADLAYDEFGDRLSVIHLRRDHLAVARSMHELGSIPGTTFGARWVLDPRAPTNLVPFQIAEERGLTHPLHRCLWYCLETDARAEAARDRFDRARWVEVWVDELNTEAGLARLSDALDLRLPAELIAAGAHRHNLKQRRTREERRLPAAEAAELHEQFIAAYGDWLRAPAHRRPVTSGAP